MRRRRRGTLESGHGLVEVTPVPVLARFVRPDNRMPGHVEVRGRVPLRRVFTASDVTAFLAEPQVHPVLASLTRQSSPPQDKGVTSWIRSMRAAAVHVQTLPSRAAGGAPVCSKAAENR